VASVPLLQILDFLVFGLAIDDRRGKFPLLQKFEDQLYFELSAKSNPIVEI